MKTIIYRGGVLKFRVPASWIEEYSDVDGGTFYEDEPNSGTMRVKIVTIEAPPEKQPISASAIMELILKNSGSTAGKVEYLGNNALLRYDEAAVEDGTKLRIFY